ncbi:DUF2812 domain-containing protein [Ureibacillus sinduriensis]|uniref:DUF2812 domain-containing protein n=1 Tax=Ureibacillus sinduriensis BLB-1 = JCM 15800 TaxID=1384057 RepID=A0A0A3HR22_9BACL|nr:DUF2812 domain-containing protein [Ureibacillus sinduriensis]KGR74819.1 hypothetical protein CD33_13680 [Ureibacillus sinduriensis BLB-1 = JCM 15800]
MSGRKIKIRLFFDYEKEEEWVNRMAKKGWNLSSFWLVYYCFEKGEPGEFTYRNEMIGGLGSKKESKEYIDFLQTSGIELVKVVFNWAYFRKKAADGPFELYSDTTSKLAYLNRIFYLFLTVLLINLFIGIINSTLLIPINGESFNHFVGGVNIGCAITLLFPMLKIMKKRKNLKQQLEIFND